MFRRIIGGIVDAAGRRPALVLLLSVLFMAGTWNYARKLELRSDFLELLPRDSPGFKAFEHQLGRVGGGATFLVVVESPDRKANEHFVDALGGALEKEIAGRTACQDACAPEDAACRSKCGSSYISYVETGTKDLQKFFDDNKWLYASKKDLKEADDTLDYQIAIRGLVENLLDDEPKKPRPPPRAPPTADGGAAAALDGGAPEGGAVAAGDAGVVDEKKPTLGMDEHYDRWKKDSKKHDDFPTGYFANEPGTLMVVRIVSSASGMGGTSGDVFLAEMKKRVDDMKVAERFHPEMKVGFAGDIPNAVAEKESTLNEAAWASGLAFILILAGIVVFYRSPWSLIVIAWPVLMGVGCAYAFATFQYGFVNTPGAFLGAIILGNGINYPIVLLSRYREFCARGMDKPTARREAVLNAFRAELVGASVASIAYGSLTITQFRGFSQFGMIGFVGMLLVWAAIVPVVPALIVAIEWVQEKLPAFLRDPEPKISEDGTSGPIMRFLGRVTGKYRVPFIIVPLLFTAWAASYLPGYLRDPWEYNFSKLGSRSSKVSGAGEWSNKADAVFQGKQNIAGTLIMADTPEQVPILKQKILDNDRADPQGALIEDIVTVQGFLPGTKTEQEAKLEVLSAMRDRLTPRVLFEMPPDEKARLLEMKPPEELKVLEAKDLPALIRRRFEENDGKLGTLMYIKYKFGVSYSDGHVLLRMAKTTDNIRMSDGTLVQTASRATIFAEIVRSMERDGPLATGASFLAVMVVVIIATRSRVGTITVLLSLLMGVVCMLGLAARADIRLNFFNFIALPITFGIGCEYPFNIFDRTRLLKGDVQMAVARSGAAVALCSYTTVIGYGSMLFSDNQALQSFGKLAMWGEVTTFTMALLFQPALLYVLLKRGKASSGETAHDPH
jgi:uncharacterized protein